MGSDRSQLPRARTFGCPQFGSEFSLDEANALLDEAGWKAGADGIREKDGVRLSLKIASTTGNQQSFWQGRTKMAPGLGWVNLTMELYMLDDLHFGRLFSLTYNPITLTCCVAV